MIDNCGRNIEYLRISITDRCNLRCVYCMPEDGVVPMRHEDILTYEEILTLVRVMASLGVKHIRVTGGEPMARRGVLSLVKDIHGIEGIETIAMTTNALLLEGQVAEAAEAGLTSLNISIDTLDAERYRQMTRGGDVKAVRQVINDALEQGIRVKLNAVPVRGMNDGDLYELAALAKDLPIDVRFIELMPVGCGAALKPVPSDEVLSMMQSAFGHMDADDTKHGFGPAKYYKPTGFTGSIGLISPISHEFCDQCNRVRLTAEGYLKLCLNHTAGCDLRALLRSGMDEEKLREAIRAAIALKPTRHGFAEQVSDREQRRMNQIGG